MYVEHGNTANIDQITINNQGDGTLVTSIDNFVLSDGKYLTSTEVNNIIRYIADYDTRHTELLISSVSDVKNNSELMTYISGQWHT